MNERASEAFARGGWFGVAEHDTGDIWMAPQSWHTDGGEEDAFECWFHLDLSDSVWNDVQFWLSCLVGVGPKRMGVRWSKKVGNRRTWRSHLADQGDHVSRLRSRGFEFQEPLGSFFLPFRIDSEALAGAMANGSPESALDPFDDALRRCIGAQAEFDALIAATPQA